MTINNKDMFLKNIIEPKSPKKKLTQTVHSRNAYDLFDLTKLISFQNGYLTKLYFGLSVIAVKQVKMN